MDTPISSFSLQIENITTNQTEITQSSEFTDSIIFRAIFALIFSLIFVLTICGGVFVCYVIGKHDLTKKRIWLYLLMMAIADTAVAILAIPVIIGACIDESILRIQWLCMFNGASMSFCFTWSVITLVAISRHKYVIIARPFESMGRRGNTDFILYIVFALLCSLFLSAAPLFGFSKYTHWSGRKWAFTFSANPVNDLVFSILWTVLHYVIPVCSIIFFSSRVYVIVKRQTAERMKMRGNSKFLAEQGSILTIISTLVFAFLVLWTPALVLMILGMARYRVPLWYSHICFVLMFMQGIVNITIYCYRHKVFKKEFRRLLKLKDKVVEDLSPIGTPRTRAYTIEYTRPEHIRRTRALSLT